jgi:hypothetical protein
MMRFLKVVLLTIFVSLSTLTYANQNYEQQLKNTINNYSEQKRFGLIKTRALDYDKLGTSQDYYSLIHQLKQVNKSSLSKTEETVYLINLFNLTVIHHYVSHPNSPINLSEPVLFMTPLTTLSDVIQTLKKRNPLYLLTLCTGDVHSPELNVYSSDNFEFELNEQVKNYLNASINLRGTNKVVLFNWYKETGFSEDEILNYFLPQETNKQAQFSYINFKYELNSL